MLLHPEVPSREPEDLSDGKRYGGAREWELEGWVTSYAAIATGEMDVVSETVSEITGHGPMTLPDSLRRYPESYRHLLDT